MFGEVALALSERVSPADYSTMKPASAHLSPTVPATFAAAIGISLSVFLLPGAAFQGEPTPLLPAISGAPGRVAADLPATAKERASEPVGEAASSAQLLATLTEHLVPEGREATTTAHRVHRRARSRGVRRAPSAPAPVAAPAAPAPPVTTRRFLSTPTTAKGKARGHDRALKPAAPPPAPAAPPKANGGGPPADNGGGNGHKGGKK
jgi:hypothetical protein